MLSPLTLIIVGFIASIVGLILIPVLSGAIGLAVILAGAALTALGRRLQRQAVTRGNQPGKR